MAREFESVTGEIIDDRALTPSEKHVVENVCIKGHYHFDELGWDEQERSLFLSRRNVRREIERVQGLMADGQGLLTRQSFMTRVKLGTMLPLATTILQKALIGSMSIDGKKIPDEERPTAEQVRTASEILNRCGVDSGSVMGSMSDGALDAHPVIDSTAVVADNDYDMKSVLQRESVRHGLENIIRMMGDTDRRLSELEEKREETKIRKKRKRRRAS